MAGEAVLVVEQEAPVRSFLEQQLADDGFSVLSAEEGRTALDLLEREQPDLVLLDAVLPDGSGFEVCGRLREGEPGRSWNRDVPVIIVSSRAEPVDRVRGFARGCDDYVPMPFVYEELVARMRAVLRRTSQPAPHDDGRAEPDHRPDARASSASPARPSSSPARSTTCCSPSRTSPSVSSARTSCSATCGDSARTAARARSTRTPAGCAAS